MKLRIKKTSAICKLEEKIEELENKIERVAKKKVPEVDYEYIRYDVNRMVDDAIGILADRMESIIERKTTEFVKAYLDKRVPEIKDQLLIEVVKASIGLNRNNDNEKEEEKEKKCVGEF